MLTITPFPCLLHFKQPAATSRGALRVRQVVFLRAERDGVVGWGECGIVPGLSRDDRADYVDAVMEICAAVNRGAELVNRDQWAGSVGDRPEQWSGSVGDRPERWAGSVGDRPERWSGSVGDRPEQWSGSVGDRPERERGDRPERPLLSDLPSVAFGLETARLDLAGGGRQRLFDTPFSRGQAALPTHGLIWMDTPAGMLAQIEGKIASGCRVIKLKVGALPFEQELALLAELRRRRPPADVELRLDANGAWTAEEARERLERLAEFTP
ncbi:MAG TPA: enolase C-terminal domain-like protein, partial [Anaerolineae bacterium]|nr:enolase C-terminal domain-like protein [Anaerolineae bacterium]